MTKRIAADHVKPKRAYEPAAANDGPRILIEHLWPRGSSERISTSYSRRTAGWMG
jgi:uncharacterized protein YeaO (DUF488 family)